MKNTTKIWYDCEFLEGSQKERMFGIELRTWNNAYAYLFAGIAISFTFMSILNLVNGFSISNTNLFGMVFFWYIFAYYAWNGKPERWINKPTIDLISIGMVRDDGQELYLISKDFNLREAWERYQTETMYNHGDMRNQFGDTWEKKVFWIRENVLKPIWIELEQKDSVSPYMTQWCKDGSRDEWFTYKRMKQLINQYGLTNAEIAIKVQEFCYGFAVDGYPKENTDKIAPNIELYGYYSAYDHVVFCWLFGLMNDLPKGFPYYTIDLQQMFDEKAQRMMLSAPTHKESQGKGKEWWIEEFKKFDNYPKQTNEHNALEDARHVKSLHEFIKSL